MGQRPAARPIPAVPPKVSDGRLAIGRLAIVLTVTAWAVYVAFTIEQQFIVGKADSARLVIEAIVYLRHGHGAGHLGDGVPHHPNRLLLPQPRPPARASRVVLDDFFDQPVADR